MLDLLMSYMVWRSLRRSNWNHSNPDSGQAAQAGKQPRRRRQQKAG